MCVNTAEALDLLERAAFDLRHGWPEAALDAAARAVEVLRKEIRERSDAPCRRACSAHADGRDAPPSTCCTRVALTPAELKKPVFAPFRIPRQFLRLCASR